jgi:hypothetical protein
VRGTTSRRNASLRDLKCKLACCFVALAAYVGVWGRLACKSETTGTSCGGPGEVLLCARPKTQRVQTGLEAACPATTPPFAARSFS